MTKKKTKLKNKSIWVDKMMKKIERERKLPRFYRLQEVCQVSGKFEISLFYVLDNVNIEIFRSQCIRDENNMWVVNIEYIKNNNVFEVKTFTKEYWEEALLKTREFSDEYRQRHSLKVNSVSPDMRFHERENLTLYDKFIAFFRKRFKKSLI